MLGTLEDNSTHPSINTRKYIRGNYIKKKMHRIFLFFLLPFSYSNQLNCSIWCDNRKLYTEESFASISSVPLDWRCPNEKKPKKCYGRMMIYYEKSKYPEYLTYSLGKTNHMIENEMEILANKNQYPFLIYFFFSLDSSELILTVYIQCQTPNDCAFDYIKELFHFYKTRTNPHEKLLELISSKKKERSSLLCYDFYLQSTDECFMNKNSKCIYETSPRFQQNCYSDENDKIDYEFMITPLQNTSIKKMKETILCNKDFCTNPTNREEIEAIIFSHAWRKNTSVYNHSNRLQIIHSFYFIGLFKFILMIFKMIF